MNLDNKNYNVIGTSVPRIDGYDKVTGRARYAADIYIDGMLYAGAQKNLAGAGLTLVIIRDDLIGNAMDITPTMLNYVTHSENGSMCVYSTMLCSALYKAMNWDEFELYRIPGIVLYNDKVAEALFFSTSPGITENSEDVFISEEPYLRSVSSTWDEISPVYSTTITYTLKELSWQ
mgnify:CR=1 FL=1